MPYNRAVITKKCVFNPSWLFCPVNKLLANIADSNKASDMRLAGTQCSDMACKNHNCINLVSNPGQFCKMA